MLNNELKIDSINTDTLNEFFSFYGVETTKVMTEFVFEMLGQFMSNGASLDLNYTAEYTSKCVMHFSMLYKLVAALKPTEEITDISNLN